MRDGWEKSQGTKEETALPGSTGASRPEAGRGQERELVPLVEVLKAIHEGLGLGSGSPEHKMCLRQG